MSAAFRCDVSAAAPPLAPMPPHAVAAIRLELA
jgi:hypothetical protein